MNEGPMDTESKLQRWVARRVGLVAPKIHCRDGLILSVQASQMHYCAPRSDKGPWETMEIGFPNRVVDDLLPFAEEPDYPLQTVYGFVPVHIIVGIIEKAGGWEGMA